MPVRTFDLLLMHAPSVYDFRNRDDILFAYLSNSDSVHVSPIFEMPPVGILAINQYLKGKGFRVEFFNVASQMLRDPELDVVDFFSRVKADIVGFDLHWMAHAHGALELAALYKEIHPQAKILVGGLSATYFHEELIGYPQIDYILRGYDTLEPVATLIRARHAPAKLKQTPNLTWKDDTGIHINPLSYLPDGYTAAVDWKAVFAGSSTPRTPYNIVIPQAGCEYSCKWCGGSRYFYAKNMGAKGLIPKPPALLHQELASIGDAQTRSHTVTMIDFWHEHAEVFAAAMQIFKTAKIGCIHFSLNRLPSPETAVAMTTTAKAVIELSPDSSNPDIARNSGRGKYSMAQMEAFIDRLIDQVYVFEIYFMIGLPGQQAKHIQEDVAYCDHLLRKYRGKRIIPYICPMLPFLDPGSEIFDAPEKFGYTLYHRSFEEHRRALTQLNWEHRTNYATQWLSRQELVRISYAAIRELTCLKAKYGLLPSGIAQGIVALIDDTTALLLKIDAHQKTASPALRLNQAQPLRKAVLDYNQKIFNVIRSQQRPIDFGFAGQQWFDTNDAFQVSL